MTSLVAAISFGRTERARDELKFRLVPGRRRKGSWYCLPDIACVLSTEIRGTTVLSNASTSIVLDGQHDYQEKTDSRVPETLESPQNVANGDDIRQTEVVMLR